MESNGPTLTAGLCVSSVTYLGNPGKHEVALARAVSLFDNFQSFLEPMLIIVSHSLKEEDCHISCLKRILAEITADK